MSIVDRRTSAVCGQACCRADLDNPQLTIDRRPAAFTLIELLVVIGIIGVVVALGVPLFGVLTGSKSQEAGQNLVAAAIGQARTVAVNEGKYAGILFYVDPATERTAMSLVIIADPASGLEDPDPYDKYKTWTTAPGYRAPGRDGVTNAPIYGDRTIGLTSDATGTFRPTVYGTGSTFTGTGSFSALSNYFGNFKPVVKTFRAIKDDAGNDPATAFNPPQNGPYPFGNTVASSKYTRVQGNVTGPASGPPAQSITAAFANKSWTPEGLQQITPYATGGEQQLLPLGVGVQLIIQPSARVDDTATPPVFIERYVRTGVVMFDPQGRLTLDPRQLGTSGTLAKYLGFTADAKKLLAGVGVVLYDRTAFRAQPSFSEADWHYQNVNPVTNTAAAIRSAQSAVTDNNTQTIATDDANEGAEELWLDSNTVPLLINRFSGSLSEGQ